MKKHILGLMLFSFIVGAAAIVYSMFNTQQVVEVPAPAYPQVYSSKTSCWKMKRDSNNQLPVIEQAVFDLKTEQLKWKLAANEANLPVVLHLFVKNGSQMRYIYSEKYIAGSTTGKLQFTSRSLSPDKIDIEENLYVIPEFVTGSGGKNKNSQPEFDANRATAVTFDYDK